ncbi:2-iminoacetate synthase [Serratia fonticola]|uniref:2-iminoacetate synthase n=1 Tax=Serratia fonticola TaxID=47917 RepID=A0A4U9WM06_SERFO|nr:2-iminoacetate synthase [Serratia fonticola]
MASDFSERLPSWDWDDLTLRINSKTARDVEQALNSAKLTREDFYGAYLPCRRPLSGAPGATSTAAHPPAFR